MLRSLWTFFVLVSLQEDVLCIEKEVIREEVVEEVIEYEYEINKDGTKTCVGERNLGKTVTTQVQAFRIHRGKEL